MSDRNGTGQYDPFAELDKFNESVYIVTNFEKLKQACIDSLYEKIKEEKPFGLLDVHFNHAKTIIRQYISTSSNCFIVHNPKTGEPSIVIYAGDFIEGDFYRQFVGGESPDNVLAGLGSYAAEEFTKAYIIPTAGDRLAQRGRTLRNMADRMSSRAGRRDAIRGISHTNTQARNRALSQLTRSYKRTLKISKLYKGSGTFLSGLAKVLGSRSFGTAFSFLEATPVADGTMKKRQEQIVRNFIEESLSELCIKYNNYHMIMSQTYISQGR